MQPWCSFQSQTSPPFIPFIPSSSPSSNTKPTSPFITSTKFIYPNPTFYALKTTLSSSLMPCPDCDPNRKHPQQLLAYVVPSSPISLLPHCGVFLVLFGFGKLWEFFVTRFGQNYYSSYYYYYYYYFFLHLYWFFFLYVIWTCKYIYAGMILEFVVVFFFFFFNLWFGLVGIFMLWWFWSLMEQWDSVKAIEMIEKWDEREGVAEMREELMR